MYCLWTSPNSWIKYFENKFRIIKIAIAEQNTSVQDKNHWQGSTFVVNTRENEGLLKRLKEVDILVESPNKILCDLETQKKTLKKVVDEKTET